MSLLCECGKPLARADTDQLTYHAEDLEWINEPTRKDPGILVPKAHALASAPQCCGYLLRAEGGSLHDLY